jgi:hypothetical protein
MSRILLDQNVPVGVRQFLRGHEVLTAHQMGWSDSSNGALLAALEAAGFDLLISSDRNLVHQQNLEDRRIGVLVLDTNRWAVLQMHGAEIEAAIADIRPGFFCQLSIASRRSSP